MQEISQPPQNRSGLRWYSKILIFLVTLLGLVCIALVALLYFGYSFPGVKLPPYLSFLIRPPAATPTPYYTPTYTITHDWTATPTRTAVPTLTLVPTRTKVPTWTLLPIFTTPSLTPLGVNTPTASGTPPTATKTP
jgi:hypothetical protein